MSVALAVLEVPLTLMVMYLVVLTFAAMFWNRRPPRCQPARRFALLVPAHNEEELLPRLLASAVELTYPAELFDIHVVADNCTDDTVNVADQAGARVHERHDMVLQGKGHALHWLLQQVRA